MTPQASTPRPAEVHVEDVEVRGHIIDSLILPKILDCIMSSGGTFRIKEITIGQARTDPSYARIEVRADDAATAGPRPGADRRSRGHAHRRRRLPAGRGRHRRGLSRRVLQHHQPADRGPPGGQVGAGRRPGDGLRHRGRRGARRRPLRADERGPHRRGDRGGPRRRARLSRRAARATPRRSGSWTAPSRPRSPRSWPSGESPANWPRTAQAGGKTLIVAGPGRRAYRQRRVPAADDSHGLRRRAVRRQRPGHARHRAGPVRHEPGRVSRRRATRPRRATPTISGRSTASAAPAASARRSSRASSRSGIMYECVRHGDRFRAGRQHPRRRPAARRHHRRARGPEGDAREAPRRDLLPDDRHDAALDRRGQPAAGLRARWSASTSTPRRPSSWPTAERSRPSAW